MRTCRHHADGVPPKTAILLEDSAVHDRAMTCASRQRICGTVALAGTLHSWLQMMCTFENLDCLGVGPVPVLCLMYGEFTLKLVFKGPS